MPGLAAALGRETVPRVREAIMTALMRIGDTPSVEAILPCLRSQDAGLRAAAIESLQALPEADRALHGGAVRATATPTCACLRPNWRAT